MRTRPARRFPWGATHVAPGKAGIELWRNPTMHPRLRAQCVCVLSSASLLSRCSPQQQGVAQWRHHASVRCAWTSWGEPGSCPIVDSFRAPTLVLNHPQTANCSRPADLLRRIAGADGPKWAPAQRCGMIFQCQAEHECCRPPQLAAWDCGHWPASKAFKCASCPLSAMGARAPVQIVV